ncbi:hypothetical protein M2432_004830 [Mycobacterium sp. OTB74]|nr:hypothetical protein [Mycobacterium sp. OTB74]
MTRLETPVVGQWNDPDACAYATWLNFTPAGEAAARTDSTEHHLHSQR